MPVSTPCRAFAEKAGLCGNEMGWRRSVPGHILLQLRGRGEVRVLTIELTRGLSWSEPVETIDCRKCETTSIEFAAAEALHWLLEIQKTAPALGATHYRIIEHGEAIVGGPA